MHIGLSKLQETVKDRAPWRAVAHGVAELDMTGRLNNSNKYQSRITVILLESPLRT